MTLIVPKSGPSEPSLTEKFKAMVDCNKAGIIIYFKPIDWMTGNIVIDNNGEESVSEEVYKQSKLNKNDKSYHDIILNLYYEERKKIESVQ